METIVLTKDRGVAIIRLNQPESRNALTLQLKNELVAAIDDVAADPHVKSVIITGTGKAFCAGGDLKSLVNPVPSMAFRELVAETNRIPLSLVNLEKPVIAAVNGVAAGAGCSLALAADVILAAESARFSQAFARVGLIPDCGGHYFLPRLIGLWKAKELIFTGDTIDAREAERLGLVNRVVPDAELETAALDLATRFARGPAKALAAAKRILNKSLACDLPTVLEMEASTQAILLNSQDFAEGAKAFFEKRDAEFTGQ